MQKLWTPFMNILRDGFDDVVNYSLSNY